MKKILLIVCTLLIVAFSAFSLFACQQKYSGATGKDRPAVEDGGGSQGEAGIDYGDVFN